MNESLDGIGFTQSVTILVNPHFAPALVAALRERVEHFTRQHSGFIGASIEVCAIKNEVCLQLSWRTRSQGELALNCPKEGECDLVQLLLGFHARSLVFRTEQSDGSMAVGRISI